MKIKLRNQGIIFNIDEFKPFADYQFAQSPQLLAFEDHYRVYFSSRPKNLVNGMPISEVLYVDFDIDFKEIVDHSRKEVLDKPILGAFDEHGIFPFHPFRTSDNELFAYLSGWSRRKSVPVETGIGIAKSVDDGKTFTRIGPGPILTASLNEPFLVGDPYVVEQNSLLHMFYIAGVEWKYFDSETSPQRVYKIKKATSTDGINWIKNKDELISDTIGPDECQALPTVIKNKEEFIMAFCFRSAFGFRTEPKLGYRLDFATSKDLLNWDRGNINVSISEHKSGWDRDMQCYPNFSQLQGKLHLLYNGNNFGKSGFGLAVEDLS
jgi:hypothetical protein